MIFRLIMWMVLFAGLLALSWGVIWHVFQEDFQGIIARWKRQRRGAQRRDKLLSHNEENCFICSQRVRADDGVFLKHGEVWAHTNCYTSNVIKGEIE